MRKAAILNSKGGVGKTTTAVNLAAGMASQGCRVLVLDMDPQGHVGVHLNVQAGPGSMAEMLIDAAEPKDCIQTLRPGIDGILSDRRLERAARILTGESYRETKLRRLMEGVEGYNFVLADCAPGMGILSQNAVMWADEVFIPVSMEFLALHGLKELEAQLEEARKMAGHNVKTGCIIPTFYDRRNGRTEEIMAALREKFSGLVLDPIRINSKLSEAAAAREDIFAYDPKSNGAQDYARLTQDILSGR